MPKQFEVVQGSPEWFQLRAGRPTASNFKKLITGKTLAPANNDTARSYMKTLLAELVLREPIEQIGSTYWLDRGKELEPAARKEYEWHREVTVEHPGYWMDDAQRYGASPDGLVGNDGLVEFKTGKPETIIGYVLDGDLADQHMPQLQGQLLVTGRKWVDIMAYDPQMKPVIERVERDEGYIAKLETALDNFLERMNEGCEKLMVSEHLIIDEPEPVYMAG